MNFPGVVSNLKKKQTAVLLFFQSLQAAKIARGVVLVWGQKGSSSWTVSSNAFGVDPGRAMKQMNPLMFPQNFRVDNGYL